MRIQDDGPTFMFSFPFLRIFTGIGRYINLLDLMFNIITMTTTYYRYQFVHHLSLSKSSSKLGCQGGVEDDAWSLDSLRTHGAVPSTW